MGAGSIDNKTIPSRELGGSNSITLNESNIPMHKHNVSLTGRTDVDGRHHHATSWGEHWPQSAKYGVNSERANQQGSADSDWDNYEYNTSIAGDHSHTISLSGETSLSGEVKPSPISVTNPYLAAYIWERIG